MKLKAPISYFGGKQLLAHTLIPLFPAHRTYIEVFGGAGALLFAKTSSPVEVYNDCDADLVNFMQVLRDRDGLFPDFYNRAALSPYSRDEWQFCRDHLNDDPNPVERARRFFVLARFSFSGIIGQSFGCGITASRAGMIQKASAYQGVLSILPRLSERIRSVLIEHRDFRDILRLYDTPQSFFYLDPPYLPETRKGDSYYKHDLTSEDHRALVEILRHIKGKVMLSGYPNALYDSLGWRRQEIPTSCHVAAIPNKAVGKDAAASHQRIECVWMNYE